MKKMFVKIKESAEEKLRKLCAGLSPENRDTPDGNSGYRSCRYTPG